MEMRDWTRNTPIRFDRTLSDLSGERVAARFYSGRVHVDLVGEHRRWQRHRSFQFNIDRHDPLGHQTSKYQTKYPRETDARHDPKAILGEKPSSVDRRLILVDETCAALSE